MRMDEALKIAKNNPGQGIRDNANFAPKWKVVYIKWAADRKRKLKAGGDFFCINPITGGNYQFRPTEGMSKSVKWSLI